MRAGKRVMNEGRAVCSTCELQAPWVWVPGWPVFIDDRLVKSNGVVRAVRADVRAALLAGAGVKEVER